MHETIGDMTAAPADESDEVPEQEGLPHLLIEVAGTRLAVPAASVDGVAPYTTPVLIPRAPRHILGFCALGERVVVAIDLCPLLGLSSERAAEREQERLVIVRAGELEAGIRCDLALGIRGWGAEALRPPHVLRGASLRAGLLGEVELEDNVAGVLDLPALLQRAKVSG
ncbi:MAG: chemotaxis protein CheW [Myxococcota bacterium]